MVGYVRDRETGIVVPGGWISSGYREMRLILITGSTQQSVRVCRPEALWVLKLIAGRNQDLGDPFAISGEPTDNGEVRRFLAEVTNPALQKRLEDEASRLESNRIFAESLSARLLPTSSESARRSWDQFKRRFVQLTSQLV